MLFEATNKKHIQTRERKIADAHDQKIGMSYLGVASDVKTYIWKTMCLP